MIVSFISARNGHDLGESVQTTVIFRASDPVFIIMWSEFEVREVDKIGKTANCMQ